MALTQEGVKFSDFVRGLPAATESDLSSGNNMPLVRSDDVKKLPAHFVSGSKFAPEFDSGNESGYAPNTLVMYQGSLYRFKTYHTGSWNSSHVELVSVEEYVSQQVFEKSIDLKFDQKYKLDASGSLIARADYYTTFVPAGDLGNIVNVNNLSSTGNAVRIAFLADVVIEDGGNAEIIGEIYTISSRVRDQIRVPHGCKYMMVYVYHSMIFKEFKISTTFLNFDLFNKVDELGKLNAANVVAGTYYQVSSTTRKVVPIKTTSVVIGACYDVSNIERVYISLYADLNNGLGTCILTDIDDVPIATVLSGVQNASGRYVTDVFCQEVDCSRAAKMYVNMTNVGSHQSSISFVSTNKIGKADKQFVKLPSSYHHGKFYYNGSFTNNWRLSCDEYDVTNIGHVLLDYCFDGQIFHVIFEDASGNRTPFFSSSTTRFVERKMMIPVPPGAVKLFVNSSLSREDDDTPVPYYRTRVFAIDNKVSPSNYSLFDILSTKRNAINVLFIGNSLTQDAVSYLPFLLRENYPDVEFNIYDWYVGGYTLQQQWENKMSPSVDAGAETFSVSHTCQNWVNQGSVKMSQVLQYIPFDLVSIQEYFNYKESFVAGDCVYFNNIVDLIASKNPRPFEVCCLFHAPKRGESFESIYQLTKSGNVTILKNTAATDIFVPGVAIYEACNTSLDSIGNQGHLSPDGTHAQEGLPCMLEAYVMLAQLMKKFGHLKKIEGIAGRITASNYPDINVPGPNGSVIEGTDDQYALAKRVAAYSSNKRIAIMAETF